MKVLHVYRTYFPDPPGGLQEAIRQICLATSEYGTESRIFTLSPNPIPSTIDFPEGRVSRCRSWFAPASCDFGGINVFFEFRKLSKWADIINFHYPWPFADLLYLLSGTLKPAVLTYHSDIVRQRFLGCFYAPLRKIFLKSLTAVIATSPAYAATSPVLRSEVDRKKLRIIPLGIHDWRSELPSEDTGKRVVAKIDIDCKPFILALGVLRYYKGLHYLLEAAKAIRGNIVIAGTGPEEENLKSFVVEHGIDNVFFTGQVTEKEKAFLLSRCRALVLPSHVRSEAFGMVLVEASMFAKPMVSCDIGTGTSYVNINKETGYVVPPGNPRQLALACNRLLDDEKLAKKMGVNARQRYETLFSKEKLGRAYADLYREIVRTH